MVYQNLALWTLLLNFWGICSDPFTTATLLNPKLSFLKNTTHLKNMTANAQLNEREKMQNNFSLQKSEYLKGDVLKYPKFGQEENHISYTGRSKREIINLALMIRCATNCLAVSYKGYGCYCGFYGGGTPVDEIDKCCQQHDDCYGASGCDGILGLGIPAYITPYTWRCSSERPYCEKASDSCGDCLCECDRKFSMCIRKYPCPTSRPLCKTRSWGYGVFQSILMWLPSN